MEPNKPVPLTAHEEHLLDLLIAKLKGWEKLLTMGKPGANQLRQMIREERQGYEEKRIKGVK